MLLTKENVSKRLSVIVFYRRSVLRKSSSSSNSSTSADKNSQKKTTTTTTMATVLQGPSTLYTSLHRPSPSLMMIPGLRSLPVWTSYDEQNKINRVAYQDPKVTKIVQHLQSHAKEIREEYQSTITSSSSSSLTSDYDESNNNNNNKKRGEHSESSLLHTGQWDWHSYLLQGQVQPDFCLHFPNTTRILSELQSDIFMGTPFGFCFFSKLSGPSTIQAHTSPINYRLRIHLPLIMPTSGDIGIRVGPTQHSWTMDQAFVLDDSYEHEVWNKTKEERILLLIDIWHPDVRIQEREEIILMFQHAKEQGWLLDNDDNNKQG